MRFSLHARVSSDNPDAVEPVLARIFSEGSVNRSSDGTEFIVDASLEGPSARELNRTLLSELRRAEKRTRLRSEWTSRGRTERFFDYVPKGSPKGLAD
jgi:hypothetical protein